MKVDDFPGCCALGVASRFGGVERVQTSVPRAEHLRLKAIEFGGGMLATTVSAQVGAVAALGDAGFVVLRTTRNHDTGALVTLWFRETSQAEWDDTRDEEDDDGPDFDR